jgi:hypothetical protein
VGVWMCGWGIASLNEHEEYQYLRLVRDILERGHAKGSSYVFGCIGEVSECSAVQCSAVERNE